MWSSHEWHYVLILDYNSARYTVSHNVISPFWVGRELQPLNYYGPVNMGSCYYELYEIKTDWIHKQIAVKTKYGYLLANK